MRKKVILIIVMLVLVTIYFLLPHGRLYFVMDSRILCNNTTVNLSPGEHTLLLVTRNYGLLFKDAQVILGVQQRYSPNWTVAYELRSNTEPTGPGQHGRGIYVLNWYHARVESFSREIHNVTIQVNQPCVLDIGGIIRYRWLSIEGMVYFRRMLHLEFS